MRLQGTLTRSIRAKSLDEGIEILDQAKLPFSVIWMPIKSAEKVAEAIKLMQTRGAPLIGAVGAYGLSMGLKIDSSDFAMDTLYEQLAQTRPTAINLRWALDRVVKAVKPLPPAQRAEAAWQEAQQIAEEDVAINRAIGEHGYNILKALSDKKGGARLNVLTHCNAGWFATLDYGTATAPLYLAHDRGLDVHVYVDETRPRNQGAITAFELSEHGIPNTVIVDNAGGHLMQKGLVDVVIVGTDRVTANGDVCNKIGTYLKALAAFDNNIPFYVALPTPTLDLKTHNGAAIPIEERDSDEVLRINGQPLFVEGTQAANPAFDVTPARLVTGLITEKGVIAANETSIRGLSA